MKRWYRVGAEVGALLVGVGLGFVTAGCSSEGEKAPGVLMVALSTDMQVPKDFDRVLVEAKSDKSEPPQCKLLAWSESDGEPAAQTAPECIEGIDGKVLKLPATVGIASQKTDEATVTVTAYRGSESVFCQSFKAVGLPTAGDGSVPMQRVDISWLETKEAGVAGSCESAEAIVPEVPVSDLPKYRDEAVFGGAEGKCFDTLGAVQSPSTLQVDLNKECTVAGVDKGSGLVLVKPAGSMGICSRAACFVPVDVETVDSWRRTPTPTELENVCKLLQSGEIRAVLAVPQAEAKTESVPTCGPWSSVTSKPGRVEDPLPLARELLAYWNIDEGKGSKTWLDATYQGRDLELGGGDGGPAYVNTRVGGRGSAAHFEGAEYAEFRNPGPFDTQTFTLSAWVSFGPEDIGACDDATWSVLSTRSGQCDGYELGIQCPDQDGRKEPSALFWYGCDGQGDPQELVAPLPENSGKWTAGDWYHLAATYAYDTAKGGRAALFLDGSKAAESVGAAKLSFSGEQPLYVGKGFHGYLDDVLVFGRALDDDNVRALYETSATVQGPSGMRWGTLDAIGSVASLGEDSQARDLRVEAVEKRECSSGGAVAHLSETQLEQLVYGADMAVLDADIDAGSEVDPSVEPWFEFSMGGPHGRPQCTWYGVVGDRGDSGYYEFDLKRPNWCANSDGCAIDPSSMRTATISTHWKNQESLAFSIRSLEFRSSSEEWAWDGIQGSLEQASVCWRPVTYEPHSVASAVWNGKGAWDEPDWPVRIEGKGSSTAEVAAFVLGAALDLSECSIEVQLAEARTDLEITIEDASGVTCERGLESGPLELSTFFTCNDCAGRRDEAAASVRKATTRIAVRKPWLNPLGPAQLQVERISLSPPNCARAAK